MYFQGMYFQGVETQALATRGVNLMCSTCTLPCLGLSLLSVLCLSLRVHLPRRLPVKFGSFGLSRVVSLHTRLRLHI